MIDSTVARLYSQEKGRGMVNFQKNREFVLDSF